MILSGITFGLALCAVCPMQDNEIENHAPTDFLDATFWDVSSSPFEDASVEVYELKEIEDVEFDWGYSINFQANEFSSNYSAPCGMDCFTSVYGNYEFVKDSVIHVTVTNINRSGFCDKKSQVLNRDAGKFKLSKTETGYRMERDH
ncbi:MAG: hypothetical protein IPM74_16340 [Crocinitomicaceae bacterium]|nr:hypothetical protein [Crocinitomicaceae bacterium]MBK8927419.1 hypothetical protein [Crocinitomicaceae bacterium]